MFVLCVATVTKTGNFPMYGKLFAPNIKILIHFTPVLALEQDIHTNGMFVFQVMSNEERVISKGVIIIYWGGGGATRMVETNFGIFVASP